MTDYISRQAAFEALEKRGVSTTNISRVPIADVRENVRAEIVHAGGEGVTQWFKCSECGTPVDITDNFCRCCGADMRPISALSENVEIVSNLKRGES